MITRSNASFWSQAIIRTVVVTGITFLLFPALSCKSGYAGKLDSLTIGFQANESASEAYIALDKGFFAQNGLSVTIKPYDTGALAVNAVLNGDMDIAGAAETPLVRNALERQAVSAIACANKLNDFFLLIGRRDKGIETFNDLAGKTVGVASQTVGEFFLSRFLKMHNVDSSQVTAVNLTPAQQVDALMKGDIDAAAASQPYAETLKNQLGDNGVSWNMQGHQPIFGLFVARNDWLSRNPDVVKRFLKAIDQANDFIKQHPEEAHSVIKARFGYTSEYMDLVWPEHNFSLSLDQSLMLALEDEARWMIANNLTAEKQVPDFIDYIYTGGLEAVKPETVTIIR